MSTEMAEACGFCYKSFLPTRKINESLKCTCQRPFFSQTVARSNLPTDRDCWIEVPKRFVRHHSSSFGETVNCEGVDGRSYSCSLVGSDIAIVGYGFEWYDFATSHNIRMGDQVVFTLMGKSRFFVQVYRANPQTVPHANVKVEQDVDVQVAESQDWFLARARRNGTNIPVKVEQNVGDLPEGVDRVPLEVEHQKINDEVDGKVPTSETIDEQFVQVKAQREDENSEDTKSGNDNGESDNPERMDENSEETKSGNDTGESDNPESEDENSEDAKSGNDNGESDNPESEDENSDDTKSGNDNGESSDGSISEAKRDGKRSKNSPYLYLAPARKSTHHWAEPGTTSRRTYVSKRGPVTSADRQRVLEAAKACPITHNSYLRLNCHRRLTLAIPGPWYRENMPQISNSYYGTLVDEEGNSWQARIRRKRIFWGNFTLHHRLEEDDVVVVELIDSRPKSMKLLVHIFRVVDVRMTVRGEAGWAEHYNIVDSMKKNLTSTQLLKAQGKGRLKRKHARGSSCSKISTHSDSAVEISHKRLRRRQAAIQRLEEISANATPRTVDSEHDREHSPPFRYARDANLGSDSPSKVEYSKSGTPKPTPSQTSALARSSRQSLNLVAPPPIRPAASASPLTSVGPSHDSSAGRSPIQVNHAAAGGSSKGPPTEREAEGKSSGECVVCWDARAEAVCIPCGHLSACMDCLTAIKSKDWGCPVCRASIQSVLKVYAVSG